MLMCVRQTFQILSSWSSWLGSLMSGQAVLLRGPLSAEPDSDVALFESNDTVIGISRI